MLEGKKNVPQWTTLEDLALMEPETSVEYHVLLKEKGWVEIKARRSFLKAREVFEEELINVQQ